MAEQPGRLPPGWSNLAAIGGVLVALLGQTLWLGSTLGKVQGEVDAQAGRLASIERSGSPAVMAISADVSSDRRRIDELNLLISGTLRQILTSDAAQTERLANQDRRIDAITAALANDLTDMRAVNRQMDTVQAQLAGLIAKMAQTEALLQRHMENGNGGTKP